MVLVYVRRESLLAVLGSVAIDTIELPCAVEEERLGGSGTFAALAAVLFHKPVSLIGIIGGDFPQKYIKLLNERGVQTDGIVRRDDISSFKWHGRYEQNLNRRETVSVTHEILMGFDPVVKGATSKADVVLLGNSAPSIQKKVLEQIPERRLVILDTMDIWIKNNKEELFSLFGLVDILLINDDEARLIYNEWNLVRVIERIREMSGVRCVIIKRGAEGVIAFLGGEYIALPAYPLSDVYDPTGAGDTFAGALAGCLANERRLDCRTLKKSLAYATVTASFCCQTCGADRFARVSREDVDKRFACLREMVCF